MFTWQIYEPLTRNKIIKFVLKRVFSVITIGISSRRTIGDRLTIGVRIVQLVYFMWNQVKISALGRVTLKMWRDPPGGGFKKPIHVVAMLLLVAILALTTGESTSYEKISFTSRFSAWLDDNYGEALTHEGHTICVKNRKNVYLRKTSHDSRMLNRSMYYKKVTVIWRNYNNIR